jgi:uncharacterized protein YrrD
MIDAHELIGRAVISREGGEKLGEVEDLVLLENGSRVMALKVDKAGLLAGSRYVRWDSIRSVGPDAVVLDRPESLLKEDEAPEVKEIVDGGHRLIGREVHTTEGVDLGRIDGFFLDAQTGRVEGFELSGGTRGGREGAFLPATEHMETGRDVVFVPGESAASLEDLHVARQTRMDRAA